MLSNFLFRIAQYVRENRQRLIKALFIAAAALIIALLIYYGVERIQRAKYGKRVQALEKQFQDADAKAKAAQARADAKEEEIHAKEAELQDLEVRAMAAENALRSIRNVNVTL